MRSYKTGNRDIPSNLAPMIATDYGVTLDWLFCRNSFLDTCDVMTDVLLAFSNVFKIGLAKEPFRQNGELYITRQKVLHIDSRFYK